MPIPYTQNYLICFSNTTYRYIEKIQILQQHSLDIISITKFGGVIEEDNQTEKNAISCERSHGLLIGGGGGLL